MPESKYSVAEKFDIACRALAADAELTVNELRHAMEGCDPREAGNVLRAAKIRAGNYPKTNPSGLPPQILALIPPVQPPSGPDSKDALDLGEEALMNRVADALQSAERVLRETTAALYRAAEERLRAAREDADRGVRQAESHAEQILEAVDDLRREKAEAQLETATVREQLNVRIAELKHELRAEQADRLSTAARLEEIKGAYEGAVADLRGTRGELHNVESRALTAEARLQEVEREIVDLRSRLTGAADDLRKAQDTALQNGARAAANEQALKDLCAAHERELAALKEGHQAQERELRAQLEHLRARASARRDTVGRKRDPRPAAE